MVEHGSEAVDIKRKCELLNVTRSTIYYKPKNTEKNDVKIMNELRDIYLETAVYGYRKMTVALRKRGFIVNHKKVRRLMRLSGLRAIYPTKSATARNVSHKVYPYLLRGMNINRPNQVWEVDITYVKMRNGFVYLVCLIDVFSRKIMGWSLSTFLDTSSCLEALNSALKWGTPDIINSDQGCQFTSAAWIEALQQSGILISMDGKGRWADNVFVERLWRTIKYECAFLHSFVTVCEARLGLGRFIEHYNSSRFHQTLNYHTPNVIYELKTIPTKQKLFEWFDIQNCRLNQEVVMTPK